MPDPNPRRRRRRGAAARRGHRRRGRAAGGRGARAQHRLRLAHDARPAVGAHEDRGEPRRPHRARQRREPMDHRRGGARRRPSLARARLRDPDRHRHGAAATTRSSRCARWRRRASRGASSSIGMRETPPSARVLGGRRRADRDGGRAQSRSGRRASRCWRCRTPHGRVDLAALMRELGARGINELHVEAGGKLNGALLAAGSSTRSCSISRRACSAIRRAAWPSGAAACPRLPTRVALELRRRGARRRRPAHPGARRADGETA